MSTIDKKGDLDASSAGTLEVGEKDTQHTLSAIISAVDALNIENGNLSISPADFNLPFMDTVFSRLLNVPSLTFTGAAKSTDDAGASITGTVDLFGYTKLSCSLNFSDDDDNVLAAVSATLAPDQTIAVPLLPWLNTQSPTIKASITENIDICNLGFDVDIVLENKDTIPVSINNQQADRWQLEIAKELDQSVTADDLVYLAGGETLDSFLPSELTSILQGIQLDNLDASFNTKDHILENFTSAITVTNGWPMVPGVVELKPGLGINLTIGTSINSSENSSETATETAETGSITTSISTAANVNATFSLGSVEVPISIGANINGSTNLWTFGIQPDQQVMLPSFSDLLALAGGNDFLNTLPAGLAQIPGINIDKFTVDVDVTNKQLTELDFTATTASSWPVISGYFEVNRISADFAITNLTTQAERQVIGDLYAQFNVGDVPLRCQLQNTPEDQDWSITAGLTPGSVLDLTQVATNLFEGLATLPDDLPKVTFNTLEVIVSPEKQTFNFAAASTDNWQLLPGFAIDGIGTSFDRTVKETTAEEGTAKKQTAELSGQISATTVVAGITLDLEAALNDAKTEGWNFKGTQQPDSKPISIGDLIQSLASIFGNVELPTILTGLTVESLAVSFNTTTKDFIFHCLVKDAAIPALSLAIDIAITHKNAEEYESKYSGTATYKSGSVDLSFELDFINTVAKDGNSAKTVAKYNADTPPTLQQFLTMLATDLGWDANLPKELNFDADLKSMTLEFDKSENKPTKIDGAGLFDLSFGSGEPWTFYTSYSNDTHFDGKDNRAIGSGKDPAYVFGAALSGILDLSKLPLVGQIPGISDFSIDKLGFYYTDAPFTEENNKLIFSVAELGTDTQLQPDAPAAFVSQPGFSLMSLFGNQSVPEDNQQPNATPLGTSTGTPAAGEAPSFSDNTNVPRKPISWLSLNKTIGPVSLDKVGLSFSLPSKGTTGELGILGLYLEGGFAVGGLALQLDGLGISFPLPAPGGKLQNPLDDVDFHLHGAAMQLQEPGLDIAGGFLSLSDDDINMIGDFSLKAGPYGLSAYGGFAGAISDPSLFAFVHLNAPLGGPPFFFVTGVSGGFGINRAFKLPTFAELPTYPLLPSAPAVPTADDLAGKSNEEKLQAMTAALVGLSEYIPVENGQYWFALGLDVTSFEMIEVSAIMSISFGNSLQFAVIGAAVMTLPVKEPKPIAYVQINFEVSYSSTDELLAVQGAITPSSFIFDGLAQLQGGFAFYTWLSGPHASDFVLTIGGYSSHYTPPKHYPMVPRVGLRANLGVVNIVGQSYFALVPNAMMAGMSVNVTAKLGPISAWFYAGTDFYLGWKPFSYSADVGITLGARFTLNLGFVKTKITVHVGVILSLWGPGFGGSAKVDLDIISFTIRFGDKRQPVPLVGWDDFKDFLPSVPVSQQQPEPKPLRTQSLMLAAIADPKAASSSTPEPSEKPLVNLYINTGLLKQFSDKDRIDDLDWLVDANQFEIRTESTAPCSALNYNHATLADDYNYLKPGDLGEQIRSTDHKDQQAPYYVYETPKGDTPWYENRYGTPPMGLTDIESSHNVTFYNYVNGNKGDAVEDVIVTLNTSNVAKSLWGNQPVSTKNAPATESTIANSLVGLAFSPMIWSPKRTTYIPYYYLVFDTNNLFLEPSVAPEITDTSFSDPKHIYQEMQDGSLFKSTQAARSGVVDLLTDLGFDELQLDNASELSTQDYVADPVLVYMSSTTETQLGQRQ